MSRKPFLSIIVPVYNTEEYLPCCIDSILAQEFTDYELILVDDGSTDGSPALCDRYAASHEQIRCIHQANGGHTSARQAGTRASAGSYIAFVDSDDWISPHMYDRMSKAARETGADIVHCNMTAVMPHKEELRDAPFAPGFYDKAALEQQIYPQMIYEGTYFKFGIAPGLVNKIFRRGILEQYLFRIPYNIIVGEDGPVTYGCMLAASSVYFIDESYYYYRSNPDSLCHHMDSGRLAENHTMFETYGRIIDTVSHPAILRQLHYFYTYQSLLTFVPVFRAMLSQQGNFREAFLTECSHPCVREAFAAVPIREITGMHNRLYAFCIRHRLYGLFRMLLTH